MAMAMAMAMALARRIAIGNLDIYLIHLRNHIPPFTFTILNDYHTNYS